MATALLGDADPFHSPRDQREDDVADEPVMNDKVGAFQQARGAKRQEIGITRAGAHEPQLAREGRILLHAA